MVLVMFCLTKLHTISTGSKFADDVKVGAMQKYVNSNCMRKEASKSVICAPLNWSVSKRNVWAVAIFRTTFGTSQKIDNNERYYKVM